MIPNLAGFFQKYNPEVFIARFVCNFFQPDSCGETRGAYRLT